MLKGKLKFIIAIGAIVLAVSYLVYGGVKDTSVYYLTVDELHDKLPYIYDDRVRVSGTVVTGSIENRSDGALKFQITDGLSTIDVNYKGVVPDIFNDGVEAVVEGEYNRSNVFQADILLAKCPTKYESADSLYEKESS